MKRNVNMSVFSMVLGDPCERVVGPQRNRDPHVENRCLSSILPGARVFAESHWFLTQPSKMQPLLPLWLSLWSVLYKHAKPYPADTTASGKEINVTRP